MTTDSLILITPVQLKKTNHLFLEHKMYKELNDEYRKQLEYFERSRAISDSIAYVQNIYIGDLIEENTNSRYEISNLLDRCIDAEKKAKWYRTFSIGGLSIGITGILLFLLK